LFVQNLSENPMYSTVTVKYRPYRLYSSVRATLGLEFQKITAQQTQVHLRLSWGSFHRSYYSNIELGGLTWGLLFIHVQMYMYMYVYA